MQKKQALLGVLLYFLVLIQFITINNETSASQSPITAALASPAAKLMQPKASATEKVHNPAFAPGKFKVGLQVGHWQNDNPPAELEWLKGNTGASGGGKMEWESNYLIAQATAELLRKENIDVDILPAVIPPAYKADVFLTIHADGSENPDRHGFKMAAPARDTRAQTHRLLSYIRQAYAESTQMYHDAATITPNMTDYYAFANYRQPYSIHPDTVGIIVETGYLSNAGDQRFLIHEPQKPAEGLAKALVEYFKTQL